MQEHILNLLRDRQGYCSGDQLSDRLGISRQALWKHIQDLREAGYDIVAVPHLGYKLLGAPDRLFPFELAHRLATKFVGRKICYFDHVGSTMEYAMQLGRDGTPSGTLVVAEGQTKGRGRLGREWASPKYKGIYVSLILRPAILPAQAPVFTLLAAVAVAEALNKIAGIEAQIKWPNDLIVKQRKLGGILTELEAEVDAVKFINIGIGLNVNTDKAHLPAQAISLKEATGALHSRVRLLQEILRQIEARYFEYERQGSARLLDAWRKLNITLGRRVRVTVGSRRLEAEAVEVDSDGGLMVRTDSGVVEKITSGEVTLR